MVIVDLLFNHITLLICNRNNFVVQLKTGAEKKADQISFLGDVIAFILAIIHLCLVRLELITVKDKLLFLSLLQLGWYWIRMTWYMLIALWETYSPVKIDRAISADIKPHEFAQGLQMLLPQSKFSYRQIGRPVMWCCLRGYEPSNVLLLWFHVPGTPRVVCCAFPHGDGALLGQLDDNRNINRHPLLWMC